ncbi:DUF3263 domain-containing protein [Micromonospora sp. NPDC000089]|uniref:DUF3263 domain-containing protein n=1 Tax=unclassified Micromonospora TaxID=2617518 RepID=UPI00367F4564
MPPADAVPAADRSEPSPAVGAPPEPVADDRHGSRHGVVPPPRPAAEEERAGPVVEAQSALVAPAPQVAGAPPQRVPEGRSGPAGDPDAESADDPAAEPAAAPGGQELTEREVRILAFEQQWWKHAGAKEQAIRDTFGISATRYYQLLNGLLDRPAALAAEPLLIGRLRRLRSSRARNRRR